MDKKVIQLTKRYVAINAKIKALTEQASAIKAEIAELAPEGAPTPYGTWQTYSESVRQSYAPTKMNKLVEQLVLQGNSELAEKILLQRTESITDAGMRFIAKKSD